MSPIALSFLLCLPLASDPCGETSNYSHVFMANGRQYEVTFVVDDPSRVPWPEDLVLRWRRPAGGKWRVVRRVTGVRLEKAVRLSASKDRDIDALVISSPGGSAEFISVAEITQRPPGLKVLLKDFLDKGGHAYRFDTLGRLVGLKFQYWSWHIEPGQLQGHIYTAINVGWDATKRRFHEGPVYVDDQAEAEATLLDTLDLMPYGTPGFTEEVSDDHRTYTYIYSPAAVPLLRRKTPPELRSARRVRVVVKHSPEPDVETYIAEIGAVGEDHQR